MLLLKLLDNSLPFPALAGVITVHFELVCGTVVLCQLIFELMEVSYRFLWKEELFAYGY